MDFLKSVTSKKALEIISAFPVFLKKETVAIEHALGRVFAEDIVSAEDIPPFSRSLVDGFAVKAKDTYGAKETNPLFVVLKGEVKIGEGTGLRIEEGECVRVSTGSMLPEGTDGVVMQEYVRHLPDAIEITKVVRQGENICFRGEDFKKGDTILKKGKRISFFDLGILATIGIQQVEVYRIPSVGIISTGDEIIQVDEKPEPGKIRDINRYTLSNLLKRYNFLVDFSGIARDNINDITEKINLVRQSDIILISGGSSKGDKDYIIESIERLGGEILFHGINIKPGKPTIFARLWDKPLFGLPGHPGSCIMVAIRFVLPLLKRLGGETDWGAKDTYTGILTTNVPSSLGIEECIEVAVERVDEKVHVIPIFSKSSVISAFSRASGYIVVPEDVEGYEKGREVEINPF